MSKNELCEEGQRLWKEVSWRNPNDYRRHLVKCKECQRGLGLDKDGIRKLKMLLKEEERNK